MYVHRSNSADALVGALEEVLREPVGEPTAPECIVVQSRGMERWLAAELAQRLGIWANPSFPFPRSIIDLAFAKVLGDDTAAGGVFEPGALLWTIARLLPEHLHEEPFAVIRNYLKGDDDHRKRIELAERIANTFDGYAVYRPEMVLSWEHGVGGEWQPVLWRALAEAASAAAHTAARAREFLRRVGEDSGPIEGFPARLSLFAISSLPPLYMRVLSALGERVDVHLFILSPSREYWGDIRSSRAMLRSHFANTVTDHAVDEVLSPPDGNPLLASMGRLHGDFQQVLEVTDDYVEADEGLYREAPAAGTMLATLQSDILALRYRHPGNHEVPQLVLATDDDSISVHSCHGPMRELEVLHDRLVAMFEAEPDLQARDVVVMMPDVEEYAPLIDAVFGGESGDRPHLPYSIANRSSRASDEVVDAFARVLGILSGRLGAPEVLDLLTIDAIRERFGISADDLGPIRVWVADAGIRWGVDHEHRAAVEQPAYVENTWRFGLDRLLLGYAMPGPELFADVLPYDDMEGSATALLGRFIDYCDTLFGFRATFQQRRDVPSWQAELQRLLDALVSTSEANAFQHQNLREAFATLAENATAAGFSDEVPLASIRSLLEAQWLRTSSSRGFLSGGVTFCQLTPMRSIPFHVVCVIGMSDGAFPRSPQPLGFDLVASSPRVGDRAPRDDDRYLFLEALLAAKRRLLITYVGQGIQNNLALPPSVLVGELLDTIEESFRLAAPTTGQTVRDQIVIRHPLQPFSPRYFSDQSEARLFSYSAGYCDAARGLSSPRHEPLPFLTGPLQLDPEAKRSVTVDELARYFTRPAQLFTERRLGLNLREDDEAIEEREPMLLTGLDEWQLGDQLLARVLADDDLADALPSVRGAGAIPLGTVGKISFANAGAAAATIGALARSWRDGEMLDGIAVDRQLDDTEITGTLSELWPRARVTAHYARIGKRSELGLWVHHLVLSWLAPDGYPGSSVAVGRPERGPGTAAVRLLPVKDPEAHLRVLLRLFWIGQSTPLPFFPEAARVYVSNLQDPADPGVDRQALERAQAAFVNQWGTPGEAYDPYVGQLFGDSAALEPDYRPFAAVPADYPSFPEVARAVFIPLLAHREVLAP